MMPKMVIENLSRANWNPIKIVADRTFQNNIRDSMVVGGVL